ncbi:hypothetical protein [Pseudomonas shirazensis]|uniref:hypothetical protein n=1 Tax=Pseudomonas shirazensis TaxID=2745494 RepID=UPI0039876A52
MANSKRSREEASAPLVLYAKSRSDDVCSRIAKAMSSIELEIEVNDGIYPVNGGRVSMAEVCRRAGVHKITLQGKSHKATTRVELKAWLDDLDDRLVRGSKSVRRRITDAVEDWKSRYYDLARSFNEMYAVEVVSRDAKIESALAKIAELEKEVLSLRARNSNGNVSIIPSAKNRDDFKD